jgi:hypothetical protein
MSVITTLNSQRDTIGIPMTCSIIFKLRNILFVFGRENGTDSSISARIGIERGDLFDESASYGN